MAKKMNNEYAYISTKYIYFAPDFGYEEMANQGWQPLALTVRGSMYGKVTRVREQIQCNGSVYFYSRNLWASREVLFGDGKDFEFRLVKSKDFNAIRDHYLEKYVSDPSWKSLSIKRLLLEYNNLNSKNHQSQVEITSQGRGKNKRAVVWEIDGNNFLATPKTKFNELVKELEGCETEPCTLRPDESNYVTCNGLKIPTKCLL